jgi:hypothetical protein
MDSRSIGASTQQSQEAMSLPPCFHAPCIGTIIYSFHLQKSEITTDMVAEDMGIDVFPHNIAIATIISLDV